jgi:alkylated DNA repair protein (DNA oxidative demethylase)
MSGHIDQSSERHPPIVPDLPEGLTYIADFVTPDEEQRLLAEIESLDFRAVVMRGQAARRTVRMFGLDYDYDHGELQPADPLPKALEPLRERAAALIEREPQDLVQILVSRYPEGAGIGWHRDAPMFGSSIVGVSLGGTSRMRFQRKPKGGEREVAAIELAPRSAYVLSGKARWSWQHSIPATKELRYSVTFRTLKREKSSG